MCLLLLMCGHPHVHPLRTPRVPLCWLRRLVCGIYRWMLQGLGGVWMFLEAHRNTDPQPHGALVPPLWGLTSVIPTWRGLWYLIENACKVSRVGHSTEWVLTTWQWLLLILIIVPYECAFNSICNIHSSHLVSLWICPERDERRAWVGAGSSGCSGWVDRKLLRVEPTWASLLCSQSALPGPSNPLNPAPYSDCSVHGKTVGCEISSALAHSIWEILSGSSKSQWALFLLCL